MPYLRCQFGEVYGTGGVRKHTHTHQKEKGTEVTSSTRMHTREQLMRANWERWNGKNHSQTNTKARGAAQPDAKQLSEHELINLAKNALTPGQFKEFMWEMWRKGWK